MRATPTEIRQPEAAGSARLPGGADPAWRAWGDAERMTKQPVPQPLRLTGLCLLVAAMGVLQRSLPAVLVAGFGRARHYRGNGGPNRAVLLGVSQEPENRRRHRQVALPHSAG
jgi:hypothetical protein